MAYVPINTEVFIAAFQGCLTGIAVSQKQLSSTNPATYSVPTNQAFAWAQEFDTLWGTAPAPPQTVDMICEACEATWDSRGQGSGANTFVPATYAPQIAAIITVINGALDKMAVNGIAPGANNTPALSQPVWYIDSVNGNDTYTGAQATHTTGKTGPLKTHGELARRWGPNYPMLVGADTGFGYTATTVNILNDLLPNDPVEIRLNPGIANTLAYLGKATVLASGTISAATALDRSTNQPWELKSTNVALGTFVGQRMRFTAGPNTNQTCWITKDLGGGFVRISTPNDPGYGPQYYQQGVSGSPVSFDFAVSPVGGSFVIEQLPAVSMPVADFQGGNGYQFGTGFVLSVFSPQSLNFLTGTTSPSGGIMPSVVACNYSDIYITGANSVASISSNINCQIPFIATVGACALLGGVLGGSLIHYGTTVDFDLTCQGGQGLHALSQGGIKVGSYCAFDCDNGGAAIIALGMGNDSDNGSSLTLSNTAGSGLATLWGKDNNGVPVSFGSGISSYSGVVPTIKGSTPHDFLMGGSDHARPWDEAGGAYGASTLCTWAHLAGAAFKGTSAADGGQAHNVGAAAHFVRYDN